MGHMITVGKTSCRLEVGDAVERLYELPAESVDVVFADPPYFLSRVNGTTCRGGKRAQVRKGAWDEPSTPEQQRAFSTLWLAAVRRVLKPHGSVWVSGTSHSIHDVYTAAHAGLGYHVINEIVWEKPNPPPNLACRSFTHASETILWMHPPGRKRRHYFDYKGVKLLNGGKQARSVWRDIGPPGKFEKLRGGGHPTQKPEALLERILRASLPAGGVVLDCFAGSCTTGAAGLTLGAGGVVLFDADPTWIAVGRKRLREHGRIMAAA